MKSVVKARWLQILVLFAVFLGQNLYGSNQHCSGFSTVGIKLTRTPVFKVGEKYHDRANSENIKFTLSNLEFKASGSWGWTDNASIEKLSANLLFQFSLNEIDWVSLTPTQMGASKDEFSIGGNRCHSLSVEDNDIPKSYLLSKDKLYEVLGISNDACFTKVYFRLAYQGRVEFDENASDRWFPSVNQYAYTDTGVLYVYECLGNKISVDSTRTPLWTQGDVSHFAIYSDKAYWERANKNILIKNVEEPCRFNGSGRLSENIILDGNGIYWPISTNIYNDTSFDMEVPISKITSMSENSDIYTNRRYNKTVEEGVSLRCKSNRLYFVCVPSLMIDPLRNSDDQSVVKFCQGEGTLLIRGKAAAINRISGFKKLSYNVSDYDPIYEWQYRREDDTRWYDFMKNDTIADEDGVRMAEFSGADLKIQKKFITKKTYFRQRLRMGKFPLSPIYAAEVCHDEVVMGPAQTYVEYEPYAAIQRSNFSISKDETACMDSYFDTDNGAGKIEVSFTPTKNFKYCSKSLSGKENDFTYNWYWEDEETKDSLKDADTVIYHKNMMKSTCYYTLVVKDGCENSVKLNTKKIAKENPTLEVESFSFTNADTYEYGKSLMVESVDGKQVLVSVVDPEKSRYNYYLVSPEGNDSVKELRLSTSRNTEIIMAEKVKQSALGDIYIVKRDRSALQCESNPIYLNFSLCRPIENKIYLKDATNQIIEDDTMRTVYVCAGSSSPAFVGDTITGGFSNGDTKYIWELKTSLNGSWRQISPNTMSVCLDPGVVTVNKGVDYYFRRHVVSSTSKTSVDSYSQSICVRAFTTPELSISAKSSKEKRYELHRDPWNVCYGSTLNFNFVSNNDSIQQSGRPAIESVQYFVSNAKDSVLYKSAIPSFGPVKEKVYLTAKGMFCNETITSSNKISAIPGENLTVPEFRVEGCGVVGKTIFVDISSWSDDYDYTIVAPNGKTTEDRRLEYRISEKPGSSGLNFKVVKSLNTCSDERIVNVKQLDIKDKLIKNELVVVGESVEKVNGKYVVCKNSTILIKDNRQVYPSGVAYSWGIVDATGAMTTIENTERQLSYTLTRGGVSVAFVRTTRYTNDCDEVSDTVYVSTRPDLNKNGYPEASSDVVCYGGEVTLAFEETALTGGSGRGYDYAWYRNIDEGKETSNVLVAETPICTVKDLNETTSYSLYATDKHCTSYSLKLGVVTISVVPDLTIQKEKISVQPAEFSMDVYQDDEFLQTVTVTDSVAHLLSDNATVSFYLEGELKKEKIASKYTNYQYQIAKSVAENGSGTVSYCMTRSVKTSNSTCVSKPYCGSISIESGFSGKLEIKANNEFYDTVRVCSKDNVVFDFDNLPLYNGKELKESDDNVSFRWKRRRSDALSWSVLNGEISENLIVTPMSDDYYYACELTYKTSAGVSVKTMSNEILVAGYKKQTPGLVYGAESYSICRNEQVKVVAKYLGSAGIGGRYQWQMSTDNKSWKNVAEDEYANGTTTKELIYKNTFEKTTLFRCVATDMCEDEVVSSNVVRVDVNNGGEIKASDIRVLSDVIVYYHDTLKTITLGAPLDGTHTYMWYYTEDKVATGLEKNRVTFHYTDDYIPNKTEGEVKSFYKAGDHTLNVYKVSKEGCVSDTIPYTFTVYDQLRVQTIAASNTNDTACAKFVTDNTSFYLTYEGGNREKLADVNWYYRYESMKDAALLTPQLAKEWGCTFDTIPHGDFPIFVLNWIYKQKETLYMYAEVSSPDYPGTAARSMIVRGPLIYSSVYAGSIAYGEKEICYGGLPEISSTALASGGMATKDGRYTYTWIKSTEGPDGPWTKVSGYSGASYRPKKNEYRIYENTFFRRVATDLCGISDTTSTYAMFSVGDEVVLGSGEIKGTDVVDNGTTAVFVGNEENSRYVFFDETGYIVLDTIKGGLSDRFVSEPLKDETVFFAHKMNSLGCLSTNDTMLNVSVRRALTGGVIAWEDYEGLAWVCSGQLTGKVYDLEEPTGENLSFVWEYSPTVNGTYTPIKDQYGNKVTTQSISLDTCKVNFVNTDGKVKTFFVQRVTKTSYYSYTLEKQITKSILSNKLEVNVIPTLQSINDKEIDGLAGTLSVDKKLYCYGDEGENIKLTVPENVENAWYSDSLGASLYGNSLTWQWERVNGLYTTNNAAKNANWQSIRVGNFDLNTYQKQYALDEVKDSTSIRFTLSDGCSSISTTPVPQVVSSLGQIDDSLFVITPEGAEEGDNIRVVYNTPNYYEVWNWFSDDLANDTLGRKNGLTLTNVSMMSKLFLQLGDGVCESELTQVPLTIYRKSNGGKISSDQKVCKGTSFYGIKSEKRASGSTGFFSYSWQYATNPSSEKSWKIVEGATEDELSADAVNEVVQGESTYFRRLATNEFGRTVYSDTVYLSYFDDLTPGILSFEDDKRTHFCQTDILPNIVTTLPKGGMSGSYGYAYKYGWEVSLDGKNYITVMDLSYMSGTIFRTAEQLTKIVYNTDEDNTFYVRVHYADEACGDVYSEPFVFTLYRTAEKPSVRQEKTTCSSDTVTVIAENQSDYTYRWFVMDNDQQTWEETGIYKKNLCRNNEYNVTQYGIQGSDILSGCKSEILFFNLDSMPVLSQPEISLLTEPLCFNSDLTIEAKEATGGVGTRSYQWQFSYDGEEWKNDDNAKEASYSTSNLKTTTYFRRLVSDMCDEHATDPIKVEVLKRVEPMMDLSFEDHGCANQKFKVNVDGERVLLVDPATNYTYSQEKVVMVEKSQFSPSDAKADLLKGKDFDVMAKNFWHEGFEEQEKDFVFATYIVAYNEELNISKQCYYAEDTLVRTIRNAAPFDADKNELKASETTPCNGTVVSINGYAPVENGFEPINYSYTWYLSEDGTTWTDLSAKDSVCLEIAHDDTFMVKRVTSNGCDKIESEPVTIYGHPAVGVNYVDEYRMSITTTQKENGESEVTLYVGNKNMDFTIEGDGELPELAYGTNILPYTAETYKDSALTLQKIGKCFVPFGVKPIYGGRIYLDGNAVVCTKADTMPTLRATNVAGGDESEEFTYFWQYKNEYVSEFMTITDKNASEKDYTPKFINVKTWYRRVTKRSDNYISYSNEVEIDVMDKPVISKIATIQPQEYFDELELMSKDYYLQRNQKMVVDLKVHSYNTNLVKWEYSRDMTTWTTMFEYEQNGVQDSSSIQIEDNSGCVYYRAIAYSECATNDTSHVFTVYTIDLPVILDEEFRIEQSECSTEWVNLTMLDRSNYYYSYEVDNSDAFSRLELTSVDKSMVENGLKFTNGVASFKSVKDTFVVKITRLDIRTKSETSRLVRVEPKFYNVDFTFTVNGIEYPSTTDEVFIAPGTRVEYNIADDADVADCKVEWGILTSVSFYNRRGGSYNYGDEYELTSYLLSPVCYYYQQGGQKVWLKVTDNEGCESKAVSTSLFVLYDGTVKTYGGQGVVIEDSETPTPVDMTVNVYPTLFSDILYVEAGQEPQEVYVYNAQGVLVHQMMAEGKAQIATSCYPAGMYMVRVGDWMYKVIKR